MNNFKAALVDLDGFLINSEDLGYEACRIYFGKLGFDNFTEEVYRRAIGLQSEVEIQRYINEGLVKTDLSVEELIKGRGEVYFGLAKEKLKLYPGVEEFLALVHKGFSTALVTSSRREYVGFVFSLFDIAKYFDEIVTGDMIAHGKPYPDPYLVAAQKLGVKNNDCVVFEDAPNGVLAAKAAVMRVIVVPSRFVKGDKIFEEADYVFDDLVQVKKCLEKSD